MTVAGVRATAVTGERELERRRIERALATRRRYRYVQPEVVAEADGWRIDSPCCSRNVERGGGVIAIARLQRLAGCWRLYRREHAKSEWIFYGEGSLVQLLEIMCRDPERQFWM